jgi:hypothetical protein
MAVKNCVDVMTKGSSWCHLKCQEWHPEIIIETIDGKVNCMIFLGTAKRKRLRGINFNDQKILEDCSFCQRAGGSKALISCMFK